MNLEVLKYIFSTLLSGIQVGIFNPCALVVLWFFFAHLSKSAKTRGMVHAGGWIFFVVTFSTNIALTFSDLFVKEYWSRALILSSYGVISAILAVQGYRHARDWWQYRFKGLPVDKFRVLLPAFEHHPEKVTGRAWGIFILKGLLLALVLNILGEAWGQSEVVFMACFSIYSSFGPIFALIYLVLFWGGYMIPFLFVWIFINRRATFKGHESLPQYQVAFYKVLQAALSLAIAIVLVLIIITEFPNI